jgi:hypothetical protein
VVHLSAISAVGLVTLIVATSAEAQYFGRNKVEYADFDFRVLASEHFDVYYYGREEAAARLAAQLAERWYLRFSRVLNHEFDRRQPLVLYGSQPEFAQTNVVSGLISDTVGGVTESAKRRIVMPFGPTLAETHRVLGHEIAHAFQFDIARKHGGGMGQPLWFIEGMAEYLARGAIDAEASLWLRDAAMHERLPARERDAARRLSPYQYGYAFWAHLADRFGDAVVEKALKPGKRAKLDDRMRHATGVSLQDLYAGWREAVYRAHEVDRPAAGQRANQPFDTGKSGRVQLGPALSPDGRHAVFFSERDRLSFDLFLADAETGRIIRKLATTAASATLDSLQPLRSTGAWSPKGDRFAFAAVRRGRAALVLVDMERPFRDREIPFAGLGQILSPTWSPDGRTLAFSALAGGFTNLYLYSLDAGTLRQLTDDAYADLHPAWSPDGREIAFATDRYSTDLTTLRFGACELAVIDVRSGAARAVSSAAGFGAQHNPQWSADGRHLYFVATRAGIANVFLTALSSGETRQITDVATGVSGITATSPSLSAAREAPVVAYTVYRNGRHALTVLRGAEALSGEPIAAAETHPVALEPIATPGAGRLAAMLDDSRTGLPEPETLTVREYSSGLALERIGQPYVSSGGSAFGTFVRGGGALLFGDMLGDRKLGIGLQVGNRMADMAFEARYLNRSHRWNWGAIADLLPSIRRYSLNRHIDYDGQPALVKEADYFQRVQLRLAGLAAYPFNRSMRVELTAGVRHALYRRDVRSQVSSLATGRILVQAREALPGGAPTTVGELGAALVYDTTVFGPTGPLLGSRYRLELVPAAGDLTYTAFTADYRQYLMPAKPYTVAMRLFHAGRFGPDGDDPRLLPSFLGSRSLVRGHTGDARRCQPDPQGACGEELFGNRLVAASLELRVPVWGMLSRQLEYGPLPLDAFVFADGGIVWSRGRTLPLDLARSGVISSIGAGVRLNAGGLPFELAAVRALDGPMRGWTFDFGFRTGF